MTESMEDNYSKGLSRTRPRHHHCRWDLRERATSREMSSSIYWTGPFPGVLSGRPIKACVLGGGGGAVVVYALLKQIIFINLYNSLKR